MDSLHLRCKEASIDKRKQGKQALEASLDKKPTALSTAKIEAMLARRLNF
jgi:hypothetical protein